MLSNLNDQSSCLLLTAPPCVSMGRNQPYLSVDAARCAERGYDIVRRPTGGRAILHTDELTYSVTAPETEPSVQGGIVESYRRLSEGLLDLVVAAWIPVTSDRLSRQAATDGPADRRPLGELAGPRRRAPGQ